MFAKFFLSALPVTILFVSCTAQPSTQTTTNEDSSETETLIETENSSVEDSARVTNVEVSGDSGTYTFAVTIESPDTGCEAYANWWEVVTPEGELLYRRILAHSHVDEQPFTRSGGPIAAEADQPVIVRVHMEPHGYGLDAMRGLPGKGLMSTTLAADFGLALADVEPQPTGCAF